MSLAGVIGNQFFNRQYSVSFGPQAPFGLPISLFSYDSLRVRFEIDKLGVGTSSKSKIEIFNLNQVSRQNIKKGWAVVLKAGYKSGIISIPPVLFQGVVGPGGAFAKREGADIVTTMECGDGEQQMMMGTIDRSYPTGTPMALVITDVIASSGLIPGIITGVPTIIFSKGYTAHGQIRKVMDELTKRAGLAWNVNNGAVNVIPIKGFDGRVAEVISSETGMIGVPSVDNGVLKFSNLLNPKLVPGSLILMQSSNISINGIHKINRSKFVGDTHDSKWQVECECIQFGTAGLLG